MRSVKDLDAVPARACAFCHEPLVIGQRTVGGSRESERQFARRSYCSWRCAQRAAGRAQYAKAKAGR